MTTNPTETPATGRTQLSAGQLDVRDVDGRERLRGCFAALVLSDGTTFTTRHRTTSAEERPDSVLVTAHGTAQTPRLAWEIRPDRGGERLHLRLSVTNTTEHPIAVERLDVLVAPTGYCGAAAGAISVAQTGWQSWSRATPPVALAEAFGSLPIIHAPPLPPTAAAPILSPWMTLLRLDDARSLLLGFTSARDQNGTIVIEPTVDGHRCVASSHLEGIALQPGATLRSEALLLLFDLDDTAALASYADELAATMDARPWPHPITAWATWYQFYTGCTEADVVRNVAMLAANRERLPLDYIRVDDSFQAHVGDWLTINDTYPRGMPALAETIKAQGFRGGIWMAPFLVSEHAALFREHPDWVLRDDHGEPVLAIFNWQARHYALDPTHPEVERWLTHVIRTMLDTWGNDYLMVDFLYAAALRGRRYDPTLTSVQAYRRGLTIIRQAAGERYVLGCGAPLAPSVGMLDGLRIGPDVATSWAIQGDSDGSEPATLNAIRSTLARGWMHGRLWINDPDPPILRAHDTNLTSVEVATLATVIALSGGVLQLSDDMTALEPERIAIAERLLPPSNQAAVPGGPYHDGLPSRAVLSIERPWERWLVATLFNWGDAPRDTTFVPAVWALPEDQRYHLLDLWSGRYYGAQVGAVPLGRLEPHGVRLLSVHADRGRPQLIGTTLHLLGGVVEVAGEHWDGQTLALDLRCPGTRRGTVMIAVPPGYRYQPEESGARHDGTLLMVPVSVAGTTTVRLHFQTGAA
jgi:alpha-galactosidase